MIPFKAADGNQRKIRTSLLMEIRIYPSAHFRKGIQIDNRPVRIRARKNDILCVILNKALKEALGERGTPGNAEYIIYVAEKLIEVYKSDHLWAVDFKCISVPEMFEKLIEYTSELSKSIIEDIENFIDDYHKRINELAYGLEDISGEKVVSFNLELRSPDMNKIDAEIKRLEEILLNN